MRAFVEDYELPGVWRLPTKRVRHSMPPISCSVPMVLAASTRTLTFHPELVRPTGWSDLLRERSQVVLI